VFQDSNIVNFDKQLLLQFADFMIQNLCHLILKCFLVIDNILLREISGQSIFLETAPS
jgi:hypothetical protein